MSQWRREASARIPELQRVIASPLVDGPMILWIELNREFEKLCEQEPPPLDLLKRIWQYCLWCMNHKNGDLRTAAAVAFAEHMMDTPARTSILPKIMRRSDFLDLRSILEYHTTPEKIESCLKTLWRTSADTL